MHSTLTFSIFARCFLARGEFANLRAAAWHAFTIGASARSACVHVAINETGVAILLCNGARITASMLLSCVVTLHQLWPGVSVRSRLFCRSLCEV